MTENNVIMENEDPVGGFEEEKATYAGPKMQNVTEKQVVSTLKGRKVAYVADCQKLNVRKGPSLEAEVITSIEKDKNVLVDRDVPMENDFVKVILSSGIEGYCMAKYIRNAGE